MGSKAILSKGSILFPRYTTINFIERNIEGIIPEDVDHYNLTVGKLYKWLLIAIRTRKDDITLRKVRTKKAREDREALINKEKDRQAKKEQDVIDAEQKFKEDRRDEIEAALRWEEEQQHNRRDDYGEENHEGDYREAHGNGENGRPPVMPVFNREEYLHKWLEDNPVIEIPPMVIDDKDNDWYLNPEDEEAVIHAYYAAKGEV